MTTETFTNRSTKLVTIKSATPYKDGPGVALTMDDGWTMGSPVDSEHLSVGQTVVREMFGFNYVGGLRLPDTEDWIFHRSDEHFAAEEADRREKWDREKRERLEENRKDWSEREAALPQWLRDRLERFRAAGGENFELEGWGYELIICELAAVYARNGGVDDDEIDRFGSVNGTSGNQHDCAKALAAHQDEAALMPAGLSPLTGSADYSDPEPLNRALDKLKTRTEDLTEDEHKDLTTALSPFLTNFAELLVSLNAAVEGAIPAIEWNDLVDLIANEASEDELLPLRPFGEMPQDEVDAWSISHTADIIEQRGISAAVPQLLRRIADGLDPEGAVLREAGRAARRENQK